jgi:DNA invertase Pin-like site-specific DNA recombinase
MSEQPAEIGEVFDALSRVRKASKEFKVPIGYIPKWYGYGRVSDRKQENDSPEAQEARVAAYWKMKVAQEPELAKVEAGGIKLEPRASSAYKNFFSHRPAGRELVGVMMPGDHLVVDKMDRLFRDRTDFAVMCDYLRGRNIRLHIANWMGASVEMDTPMGDWIMNSMANNAAFESAQTADRVRRAQKRRREKGLFAGVGAPWFCKIVGTNDKNTGINDRRLVWCKHMRKKCEEVVMYRDKYGLGGGHIARMLEKRRIFSGGEPLPRPFWDPRRVVQAYWLHKAIEQEGEFDPNQVKFKEVIKKFRERWIEENGPVGRRAKKGGYDMPDPCDEPLPEDPDGIVDYSKKELDQGNF